MSTLWAASLWAAENKPSAADGPAIPPGQEELIGEMLGLGTTIAGCALASGGVEYTIVRATYSCEEGMAVVELAHPSTADRTAIQTKQFAITLKSGSPPRSLLDALVSLIRAREDAFKWEWLGDGDDEAGDAGEG